MISSYAVGATFEIVDRASPILRKMAEGAGVLDREILKVTESLERFSNFGFSPKLMESIKGVSGEFGNLDRMIGGTRSELAKFGETTMPIGGIMASLDGVKVGFDSLPSAAIAAKDKMATGLKGFTAPALRELHEFEAAVAKAAAPMRLAAAEAAGGASLAQRTAGARVAHGGGAHFRMEGAAVAGGHVGGDGMMGALAGGGFLYETIAKGFDLEALRIQAENQGADKARQKRIYAAAVANSNMFGPASITGSYDNYLEIKKGVQNWDLAEMLLPDVTKSMTVMGASARRHGHHFDTGGQAIAMSRALEEFGILQPRKGETRQDAANRARAFSAISESVG